MKNKICHFTSVHSSNDIRIFKKQCVTLAKYGYDVTLVVSGNSEFESIIDNVRVISLKIPVKNRIQFFLYRSYLVYKKAIEIDADIYQLHDPELIPYGLILKNKGKIVIFDSHEDIPFDIASKRYLPKIFRIALSNMYRLFEKIALRKFDYLISVTPHIVEKLKKINHNTVQITNYPILQESLTPIDYIKKTDYPTIAFAGGVNPLWMHEMILDAIKDLNVKYIIAGNASNEYLEILKKHPAWYKVEYLGQINYNEVRDIYEKSHIGIAILNYSASVGGNLGTLGNTKLFEIMAAGLPVICTDFILWKEIINNHEAGICIDPRRTESIKEAVITLMNDPELALKMGMNGKLSVYEKYSWKSQEEILLQLYKTIVR